MSLPHSPPPPPPPHPPPYPPPQNHQLDPSPPGPLPPPPHPPSLYKQHSWSPDAYRDAAWRRRKGNNHHKNKNRRSKSVTEEDLDELKACIELGFGFDSPDQVADQRLSDTLPALGLYYAVNKNYYDSASKNTMTSTPSSSTAASECGSPSLVGSPHTMFGPGETPQTMKTRLRQWAQVVACSVQQFSSSRS